MPRHLQPTWPGLACVRLSEALKNIRICSDICDTLVFGCCTLAAAKVSLTSLDDNWSVCPAAHGSHWPPVPHGWHGVSAQLCTNRRSSSIWQASQALTRDWSVVSTRTYYINFDEILPIAKYLLTTQGANWPVRRYRDLQNKSCRVKVLNTESSCSRYIVEHRYTRTERANVKRMFPCRQISSTSLKKSRGRRSRAKTYQ